MTRITLTTTLLLGCLQVLHGQNFTDFPNNCDVPSRSFPTALQYYGKFHPSDSVLDFFCKAQLLTGTGTIRVEFNDEESSIAGSFSGAFQQRFSFDGTPKMSKRDIGKLLTEAIQTHLSTARGRKNVRPLSDYGVPGTSDAGKKVYYNATIKITFDGIEVMGAGFRLVAYYETSLASILSWMRGNEKHLEFPMLDVTRSNVPRPTGVQITVPLSFRAIVLTSDDAAHLKFVSGDVKKTISDKYAQFRREPGVFTDGNNAIMIQEGMTDKAGRICGPSRQVPAPGGGFEMQPPLGCREWEGARPYLKISYAPNEGGPLDPNGARIKADLQKVIKEISGRVESEQKSDVEGKKKQNAVF